MNNKAQICIFLHIPKCAGTSIVRSITKKAPKSVFKTETHGFCGHMSVNEYLSLFRRVPLKSFNKRIIAGHLLFGIHQKTKKSYTYVTIIRHPIGRLWSQYCYMKQLGIRNIRCRGCDVLVNSEMSFESFVSLPELLPLGNFGCIPNLQTFVIAGEQSPDMLDQAKRNIKNYFAVIGIQEQFESFRTRLSRYLEMPIPELYANQMTDKNNELLSSVLSPELRKKIEQRDALDMELHDYIMGMSND